FPVMAAFDLAAELVNHRLLAVAYAEQRQAQLENIVRRQGGAFVQHAARPAGKKNAARVERPDPPFLGVAERPYFAIHAYLAQTARDQLGDLRPKIEDKDAIMVAEGAHGPSVRLGGGASHGKRLQETAARRKEKLALENFE